MESAVLTSRRGGGVMPETGEERLEEIVGVVE